MRLNLKRALKFWTVGATGAIIQSAVFYVLTRSLGVPDFVNLFGLFEVPWALGWAIVCASISNYVFNEYFTWNVKEEETRTG
jgi:putative flippase GtrA